MERASDQATQVHFFANASSLHVQRWLDLAARASVRVVCTSVVPNQVRLNRSWTIGAAAALFRYAMAGLRVRRDLARCNALVHAHNASGYGLMALLSGRPYIVTVYGTEVYDADVRGIAYTWLLKRILRAARHITCTTPAMRAHLIERFGVRSDRISSFSMGIPLADFVHTADDRSAARAELGFTQVRVVTSNRRMTPHYRIDAIVSAFANHFGGDDRYRLVLFEGDCDPEYAKAIRLRVEECGILPQTHIVPRLQTREGVRRYLLASDVVVSVPKSDQLAASVLEALACGCVLALADLPSYREVFERRAAVRLEVESAEGIGAGISNIFANIDRHREAALAATSWLENDHSDEAVSRRVANLYRVGFQGA